MHRVNTLKACLILLGGVAAAFSTIAQTTGQFPPSTECRRRNADADTNANADARANPCSHAGSGSAVPVAFSRTSEPDTAPGRHNAADTAAHAHACSAGCKHTLGRA